MAAAGFASLTLHQARDGIADGSVAPSQLLDDVLARITKHNPAVHAYVEPPDRAAVTQELHRQLDAHPKGRLRGVPITIKDNICVTGVETTCASRILQGFRSPYDATVIERLRAEGAVLLPRANMDEFAFGSSTENSAARIGPTLNPRADLKQPRVPGGSSGGSAAAVAGDLAVAALGSDTGGSIRQPAAFCGVVGLKPTYGRVSRYGLVAFASSLDQIGPITKDVRDAAILLSVIAGHDPRDSTSAPKPEPDDYEASLDQLPERVRLGIPALPDTGLEPNVKARVDEAIQTLLKTLATDPVDVDLRNIGKSIATYYVVATAEASSNLARYDGVQYGRRAGNGTLAGMNTATRTDGFGAESKRRILLGTYVLSQGYYDAYYLQGMRVRTLIKRDFDEAFKHCDVIAMPTSPTVAFRPGEKLQDPLQMYLSDIYTISANLAGVPAISVYCGTGEHDLPIGLQLLAPPFKEALLLQVAHRYEQQATRAALRSWP